MSVFPIISKNETPFAIGVGSALMDIILLESEDFIKENGITKGGMELVDADYADKLCSKSNNTPKQVPGGSACNTIIGLGQLSGTAKFIGTRGDDQLGEELEEAIKNNNVTPILEKISTPTGRVLSVITPDAQRSMLTYLGAAAESSPETFTADIFQGADLVHVEGYLLFNEKLIRAVLQAAKDAKVPVSLDLASFTVIDANPQLVKELVKEYVDILLANEDEAKSYTGTDNEVEALAILAKDAECAVVKIGKRGSLVSINGEVTTIAPYGEEKVIDTTGAGDLWASGFLYGLINNKPIKECGRIASMCGYEVCMVEGAHIPENKWNEIKATL